MAFLRLGIGDIRSAVKICGNSSVHVIDTSKYKVRTIELNLEQDHIDPQIQPTAIN